MPRTLGYRIGTAFLILGLLSFGGIGACSVFFTGMFLLPATNSEFDAGAVAFSLPFLVLAILGVRACWHWLQNRIRD